MRLNMLAGAAALLAVCGAAMAAPFTFQGELRDGGTPVNGVYDFQFSLFGAAVSGAQFGSVMCADNVAVVDGRFTVVLDFGDVFDGTELNQLLEPSSGRAISATVVTAFADAFGTSKLSPKTKLPARASFKICASFAAKIFSS